MFPLVVISACVLREDKSRHRAKMELNKWIGFLAYNEEAQKSGEHVLVLLINDMW